MIPWLYCYRVLLLLLVVVWFLLKGEVPVARADDTSGLEQRVHELVNGHRTSIGLEPLNYSEDLAIVARRHSRDMAKGYVGMGHEGVEERERVLLRTIAYTEFAENVGINNQSASTTAQAALTGWLNSPGHRTNLEGKFDLTGIGIAQNGSTFFFTQIFLTTHSSSRPSVETQRPRERVPVRNYPSEDDGKLSSRNHRAYAPSYEQEEIDPRKRAGRKRVRGGYVQDLEEDR